MGRHAIPEIVSGVFLAAAALEPAGIVKKHKLALALGHP